MRARTAKGIDRDERAAAAKQTLLAVSDSCSWCGRQGPLDIHHVAGREGDLIDDLRFCILVCRPCHQTIEERVMGADSTALGLALLRHRGGASVWDFWRVTGREYPPHALVEQWSRRLTQLGRE